MSEQGYFERDIQSEFQTYQDLYGLPIHHCVAENTPGPFLDYCYRRRFFVIVFVYSADYKTYLIPVWHADRTPRIDRLFSVASKDEILDAYLASLPDALRPYDNDDKVQRQAIHDREPIGMKARDSVPMSEVPGEVRFVDEPCKYRLPAGAIKLFSRRESVLEAVRRIVVQEFSALGKTTPCEITPLAYIQNHFFSGSKYHRHDGMGFMCRADMSVVKWLQTREAERVRIIDADIGSVYDGLIIGTDRQVFEYAKKKIKHTQLEEYDEEIAATRSASKLMKVHNALVKPLFSLFGRGTSKKVISQELEKHRATSTGPCKFLDISCGEDKFLFEVSRGLPPGSIVVGNDVAWESLAVLIRHKVRDRVTNVFFTNHSSCEAPYRQDYFDISICKNSLHHMREYQEAVRTIRNLVHATRDKVIVVDYEEPRNWRKGGVFPFLFNVYYRRVLKDQGRNFLTLREFRGLFEEEKDVKEILDAKGFVSKIHCVRSLFGNTMIAVLTRENNA